MQGNVPKRYIKQCSVSARSQQTETSSTHNLVDENDYCAYCITRIIRMAAQDRAKPAEYGVKVKLAIRIVLKNNRIAKLLIPFFNGKPSITCQVSVIFLLEDIYALTSPELIPMANPQLRATFPPFCHFEYGIYSFPCN